jgi:hypothetical protein
LTAVFAVGVLALSSLGVNAPAANAKPAGVVTGVMSWTNHPSYSNPGFGPLRLVGEFRVGPDVYSGVAQTTALTKSVDPSDAYCCVNKRIPFELRGSTLGNHITARCNPIGSELDAEYAPFVVAATIKFRINCWARINGGPEKGLHLNVSLAGADPVGGAALEVSTYTGDGHGNGSFVMVGTFTQPT